MRSIGRFLIVVGLVILVIWGLYFLFTVVFPELPSPVKVAFTAIAIGFILLLASLARERHRASKEEREKFKEVEK
jgi:undecaprenyl pyrophosphate phosphatase UppP